MTILSATDLATELNTTGREVRKFLRSITPKDEQPGKGARWGVEKKALRTIKKEFATWSAAKETPAEVAPKAAPEEPQEIIPSEEPTEAELAAIEAGDID